MVIAWPWMTICQCLGPFPALGNGSCVITCYFFGSLLHSAFLFWLPSGTNKWSTRETTWTKTCEGDSERLFVLKASVQLMRSLAVSTCSTQIAGLTLLVRQLIPFVHVFIATEVDTTVSCGNHFVWVFLLDLVGNQQRSCSRRTAPITEASPTWSLHQERYTRSWTLSYDCCSSPFSSLEGVQIYSACGESRHRILKSASCKGESSMFALPDSRLAVANPRWGFAHLQYWTELKCCNSPFELIAIKKKNCLRVHPEIGIFVLVAIASTHAQHWHGVPEIQIVVGPCGGHARKDGRTKFLRFNVYDGRTEFSNAAPVALQPFKWPYGVLKCCACRASTFKMAVRGPQVLRPSRKQMEFVK